MEYFGIKQVEGKAVMSEPVARKKRPNKNLLNVTVWMLGALNIVAYTLLAVKLF